MKRTAAVLLCLLVLVPVLAGQAGDAAGTSASSGSGAAGGGVIVSSFTVVQHQMFNTNLGPGTGSCAAAASTCTVNVTAIGAGHLLICIGHAKTVTLTSCSGDTGTWVHCPNCFNAGGGSTLGVDDYYILSTVGGGTAINCNFSGAVGFGECGAREYSVTSGAVPIFDTSNASSTGGGTCTPCSGVTLTPTSSTDLIVQSIFPGANATAVGAPYGNGDFNQGGMADRLNTNSGTAPSWTMTGTPDTATVNGIAFRITGQALLATPPARPAPRRAARRAARRRRQKRDDRRDDRNERREDRK